MSKRSITIYEGKLVVGGYVDSEGIYCQEVKIGGTTIAYGVLSTVFNELQGYNVRLTIETIPDDPEDA